MAIVRRDNENVVQGKAYVRITGKGLMRFSNKAADAIGIKGGDRLAIYQDDENKRDWYVKKESDGLVVYWTEKLGVRVSSKKVATEILESLGAGTDSLRVFVAKEPDANGLFALLTAGV